MTSLPFKVYEPQNKMTSLPFQVKGLSKQWQIPFAHAFFVVQTVVEEETLQPHNILRNNAHEDVTAGPQSNLTIKMTQTNEISAKS